MATKKCTRCKHRLPATAFGKDRRRRDGLAYWCRECRRKANRQWVTANPAAAKRNNRTWCLRRKYGITTDVYEQLLEAQHGVCAICRRPPNGRRLAVDHDHTTNNIRGLLCTKCNTLLGYADDDPARCTAAAAYLAAPPAAKSSSC